VKLYTFSRSSAAFRVRIALNLKGLQYESLPKHFARNEHRAPEYLALNPHGLIPALAVDGVVLSQSLAIIEYLNDRHPEPPLLPADPLDRARVRSMALTIACEIHPLNNLRVLNYLRAELQQDDTGVGTWYRHWVSEGFAGLEQQAREFSAGGRYCFGDALSLADVCLVPQMFNARRFKTDLAPFPTLVGISTHLEALPAFAAARPEVQPDYQ
jgi:maleylacetoacetate isomerase/maleylpyruvate isomerase